MKISELSLIRESVRDYSSKPVETGKLNEVLESAGPRHLEDIAEIL